MTTVPAPNPHSPFSPTLARVAVVSTLAFWLAVVALLIVSPSLVDDLVGVPAICLLYAVAMGGCGLLLDRRGRPRQVAVGASRLQPQRPSRVSVS